MGLDNGIVLKTREKIDFDDWEIRPEYVSITFDEYETEHSNDGYVYDICYWRKCWDVRAEILYILDAPQDGGVYEIEKPEQVAQIQEAMVRFLTHPDTWEDSIWSLDEYAPYIARDILNLGWLKNYMEEHKGSNITVEFYDSY